MSKSIREEFKVHVLNDAGIENASKLAELFSELLFDIEEIILVDGMLQPEYAIAKRKLEEACFYCKKAMASYQGNQKLIK